MSERCIVAVRFTGAGSSGQVRKAVGGFLRYVQHRDLHPKEEARSQKPEVAGLLKYVAYRDQAAARAELFGPSGALGSAERKAFSAFVLRSIEQSRPQLYHARSGEQLDRRRAVYRMVISPERAAGLDLRRLTAAAVSRLESEVGEEVGLQWIAAIHRNTAHPHVHLVIAGMRQTEGGFARVDLTRPRLAAIKQAVALEIQRQRDEHVPEPAMKSKLVGPADGQGTGLAPAWHVEISRPTLRAPRHSLGLSRHRPLPLAPAATILRLRAAAHRYRRQMARDAEEEARRRGWEHAA